MTPRGIRVTGSGTKKTRHDSYYTTAELLPDRAARASDKRRFRGNRKAGGSDHRVPGWQGLGDVIVHFRFIRNHHHAIEKIALVTDAKVAEIFPAIANHFVKAEVRHLEFGAFDEALAWIDC
jgi:hypothetical protein